MPIAASDIEFYKSNGTDSTGGTITATALVDNTLNNLFDEVSGDESLVGLIDYRKIFVKNNHATLTWDSVVAWVSTQTSSSDDEVSLGIGSASDDDGSSELSALSGNSVIAVISDGADTRDVTLVGEDAAGARVTETLTLNGAVEVVGAQTFSKLYLAYISAGSASRTVTIKQGSGGTTRGTIAINKLSAILFLAATSKAAGFELGDIAASGAHAIWLKRVVDAGAAAYTNNTGAISVEGQTS